MFRSDRQPATGARLELTGTEKDSWKERGARWAATAARGRSADDSFNRMIIAQAAIRPGDDVLDIASGTGDPAITIALALDGEGSVTAATAQTMGG